MTIQYILLSPGKIYFMEEHFGFIIFFPKSMYIFSGFSYVVSIGVVDKLSTYFNNVRGPINDSPQGAEMLQHGLGLLISMAKLMGRR